MSAGCVAARGIQSADGYLHVGVPTNSLLLTRHTISWMRSYARTFVHPAPRAVPSAHTHPGGTQEEGVSGRRTVARGGDHVLERLRHLVAHAREHRGDVPRELRAHDRDVVPVLVHRAPERVRDLQRLRMRRHLVSGWSLREMEGTHDVGRLGEGQLVVRRLAQLLDELRAGHDDVPPAGGVELEGPALVLRRRQGVEISPTDGGGWTASEEGDAPCCTPPGSRPRRP